MLAGIRVQGTALTSGTSFSNSWEMNPISSTSRWKMPPLASRPANLAAHCRPGSTCTATYRGLIAHGEPLPKLILMKKTTTLSLAVNTLFLFQLALPTLRVCIPTILHHKLPSGTNSTRQRQTVTMKTLKFEHTHNNNTWYNAFYDTMINYW